MKQYRLKNVSEEKENEARNAIIDNGTLYKNGSFKVSGVEGYYKRDGSDIVVVITDKPWLASWEMIEEKLSQFFS